MQQGVRSRMNGVDVRELIDALRRGDDNVRLHAAAALGQHRDQESVELLIKALSDESSDVRCYVIDALGEIGDLRAIEPLLRVITTSGDGSFAAEAIIDALLRIGEPAVGPLISILESGPSDLQPYAADLLGILGYKRAGATLTTAAKNGDPAVRKAAVYALSRMSTS